MGRDWFLGFGARGRPGLEECDIVKVSTERIGGLRIAVVIGVDDPRPPDQPLRHTKVALYLLH
jgi:hypothetical protein